MTSASGLSPVEYNVVVRLDPTEERTPGGIFIIASKQDRDELATDEGTIDAISPHAFTYADWADGAGRPVVGDRVLFSRYAGALHERDGAKFRIIKDKDVVAVIVPNVPAEAA